MACDSQEVFDRFHQYSLTESEKDQMWLLDMLEESRSSEPVELAERAINYSSRKSENVLDLFGGSGSTLMAAERMGRRAFLMELDPSYCDVIVQRWQQYTNEKATNWRGNEEKADGTVREEEA